MAAFRPWWANCFAPGDPRAQDEEIAALDALEDSLGPLDEQTAHLRRLIGTFEACHPKSQRHVEHLLDAIGVGRSGKGRMRREPGTRTTREGGYEALLGELRAWCAGEPEGEALGRSLGERTPRKVWQVERVAEKIARFADPADRWSEAAYGPLVVEGADPGGFAEASRCTVIRDGEDSEISLAQAIDWLTGCNWDFPNTVRAVLAAIGGQLESSRPLALHARNVHLCPAREPMQDTCASLRDWLDGAGEESGLGEQLGAPTPVKRWLAASLEKTLRLQYGL